jgi:anhydro-N-acetylmuramic acid kinase
MVMKKNHYKVLGLMSGTSLDGIDIACCTFTIRSDRWKFTIDEAETIPYPAKWKKRLTDAYSLSGNDLAELNALYGRYLGEVCQSFIVKHSIRQIDCIASHGHTVFHQPSYGYTLQIGDGNSIHAITGLPVVYDFRSLDVALGGQGAPLVPIGDHFLFAEYDVCLNLGGIANLSCVERGKRIAYDICFVNMSLNYLTQKVGKDYDHNGTMASDGKINLPLLRKLTRVYARHHRTRPSLGREIFEKEIQPLLDQDDIPLTDRLATVTESIAKEIVQSLVTVKKRISVLCTGGGAFNAFLIYRMVEQAGDAIDFILPDSEIINFKEALVFAFLGVKRLRNEVNSLASVTKARRDSSGGVLVGF